MCGLNALKYCGNKTEEYVITLFCNVLYRYLPSVGGKDYFVRIREKQLSGTPHVRIPVHPTTGWGAFRYGSVSAWGAFTGTPPRLKTGYLEKMVYLCTPFQEKHSKVYTDKIFISGFY